MDDKKNIERTSEKISRREALKRMAKTSGQICVIAAFPSWVLGESVSDKPDSMLAYYSWYGSYGSYYSSYGSYYYSHSSYYSNYASYGYSSYYRGYDDTPGATCFIDTLKDKKKK